MDHYNRFAQFPHVLALEGILAEQYFEGIGPPCILICTLFAESSYSWFGSCKTIYTNAITRGVLILS
jgi:hypothetical protein